MSPEPDPWDGVETGAGLGVPVAIGGRVSPAALLGAHRRAIFCLPSADPGQIAEREATYGPDVAAGDIAVLPGTGNPYATLWWSPATRWVIPAGEVHLGRSAFRSIRAGGWTITLNRDFDGVIDGCRGDREPRWITDELAGSLRVLAGAGHAHTVEVWEGSELVGGLFACSSGSVMIMESAFRRRPDAAKAAIADLSARAAEAGFTYLDAEVKSGYTERMGARAMARPDYLGYVADGAQVTPLPAGPHDASDLRPRAGAAL